MSKKKKRKYGSALEDANRRLESPEYKKQQKAEALNQGAAPFDRNLRLNQLSTSILDNQLSFLKSAERYKEIDSEILFANLIKYSKKYIITPFGNNHWDKSTYHKTANRSIVAQAKLLSDEGYVEIVRHQFNYQTKKGKRTRIKAKEKLLKLLRAVPNNVYEDIEQLVILKNKKDNKNDYDVIIDYENEALMEEMGKKLLQSTKNQIHNMRKKLIEINKVNTNAKICYKELDLSVKVVAIFRGNFDLYGRLHSRGLNYYQGYSKEERIQFTINGKPVVELDFKALHPYLLYAAEGIQYEGDPYSAVCEHEKARPFLKQILLRMLNCGTFQKAALSADEWLEKEERKKAKRDGREPLIKILLENNLIDADARYKSGKYIHKFREAHNPIGKYLLRGKESGLKLMNKDAKIALEVCSHFAKKNVPILSIHDSFIIQEDYKTELEQIMLKKYQLKTRTKFTIPITPSIKEHQIC
jgi:hypothetical protein